MTDIMLHRRLTRRRVVPKPITASENLKIAQQIQIAMNQIKTPTKWQQFVEAWERIGKKYAHNNQNT